MEKKTGTLKRVLGAGSFKSGLVSEHISVTETLLMQLSERQTLKCSQTA